MEPWRKQRKQRWGHWGTEKSGEGESFQTGGGQPSSFLLFFFSSNIPSFHPHVSFHKQRTFLKDFLIT